MRTLRLNLVALAGVLTFAIGTLIATAAAAQSVTFQPIVEPLTNALVVVAGAFITFISTQISLWLGKKLKLDSLKVEETIRGYLNEAAHRGIQWAVTKLQTSNVLSSVEVKNQVLALATQYLIDRVPDALKRFNLDTESLKQYLEARVGEYELDSLVRTSAKLHSEASVSGLSAKRA